MNNKLRTNFDSYFNSVHNATNNNNHQTEKKDYTIPNLFELTLKDGKASVLIRFLPSCENETSPFIETRSHFRKNPKTSRWFVSPCPTLFGKSCPLCVHNYNLFKNAKGESDKEAAKKLIVGYPTKKYISNIYVIRNDNAPETEGKIFRYQYGPLIMKKINECMDPSEDLIHGKVPGRNPFDWINGTHFNLIANNSAYGYNLDKSSFDTNTTRLQKYDRANGVYIDLSDDEIFEIQSNLLELEPYKQNPDEFKSYEEICESFESFFGYRLNSDTRSDDVQTEIHTENEQVKTVKKETSRVEANTAEIPTKNVEPKEAKNAYTDEDSFLNEIYNM